MKIRTKTKSDVVVEQYAMETFHPKGIYHSNCHIGDEEAIIQVTRRNSMRKTVDIMTVDKQTCMLLK